MWWYSRAVKRNEWIVGSIGKAVNSTSNNFLSSSTLACDQHEDIGLSDPLCKSHDVHHLTCHNRIAEDKTASISWPHGRSRFSIRTCLAYFLKDVQDST